MTDVTKQTKTIFVGGLDQQVTQQTLHDAFIPFGDITDVSLPKPELQVPIASIIHKKNKKSKNKNPKKNTPCPLELTLHEHSHRASNKDPHRGFGYVEFSLAEDAREAIDNMDQSELYGRVIKVNQAKPQKNRDEGLGSRTAVWEQVCFFSFFFHSNLFLVKKQTSI